MLCSGGIPLRMNSLTVSTPYSAMLSSGSTPLYLDLLILSHFISNFSPVDRDTGSEPTIREETMEPKTK